MKRSPEHRSIGSVSTLQELGNNSRFAYQQIIKLFICQVPDAYQQMVTKLFHNNILMIHTLC
jgi:hypothetical protein